VPVLKSGEFDPTPPLPPPDDVITEKVEGEPAAAGVPEEIPAPTVIGYPVAETVIAETPLPNGETV
jgi:hypothetical protein